MLRHIILTHEKTSSSPHAEKKPIQTFDGIALNKADPNRPAITNDVPDGLEQMETDTQETFSNIELNQFEISSDDESSSQGGAARSRPVRAVAKKRKNKIVATKSKGRKQQMEEIDDVYIE